jgi:hypothetical protein
LIGQNDSKNNYFTLCPTLILEVEGIHPRLILLQCCQLAEISDAKNSVRREKSAAEFLADIPKNGRPNFIDDLAENICEELATLIG